MQERRWGSTRLWGSCSRLWWSWFPEYEELGSKWKRVAMMGLCFVIPVVSLALLVLLGEQALNAETAWLALSAGFAAFFGSQAAQTRQLKDTKTLDMDEFTAQVVERVLTKIGANRLQEDIEALFGVEEVDETDEAD